MTGTEIFVVAGGALFALIGGLTLYTRFYNLDNIKSKTVGDGQHGTVRWATASEVKRTYRLIPFTPQKWRAQAEKGQQPTWKKRKLFKRKVQAEQEAALPQGIVVGCQGGRKTKALVDTGDVHVLMIDALWRLRSQQQLGRYFVQGLG